MDGEGLLNEELPNCWECPKCYQEDSSEKAQVRERFQSCTVRRKQMSSLEITFAFACFFWPKRLFFILFVIFFPLWLAIFLLSCKFCFFCIIEYCSPWDSANSQCFVTPWGPWKRGATAGLFEEGSEVSLVCEEWNLRGGSDLSQLVNAVVYWSFQLSGFAFCLLHLVAESPALVPVVSYRGSCFSGGNLCCDLGPKRLWLLVQWSPVLSEGQKHWPLRQGRQGLLRACTGAAAGLLSVIMPWGSPPGALNRRVGAHFLVASPPPHFFPLRHWGHWTSQSK